MQRMVTFRLNRDGHDIAVNPTKVLYVGHYENGASTLHFSKDCFVRVQGCIAEVVHKLETAAGEADVAAGVHTMTATAPRAEAN